MYLYVHIATFVHTGVIKQQLNYLYSESWYLSLLLRDGLSESGRWEYDGPDQVFVVEFFHLQHIFLVECHRVMNSLHVCLYFLSRPASWRSLLMFTACHTLCGVMPETLTWRWHVCRRRPYSSESRFPLGIYLGGSSWLPHRHRCHSRVRYPCSWTSQYSHCHRMAASHCLLELESLAKSQNQLWSWDWGIWLCNMEMKGGLVKSLRNSHEGGLTQWLRIEVEWRWNACQSMVMEWEMSSYLWCGNRDQLRAGSWY